MHASAALCLLASVSNMLSKNKSGIQYRSVCSQAHEDIHDCTDNGSSPRWTYVYQTARTLQSVFEVGRFFHSVHTINRK